jgi:hypothetical protein
MRRLIVLWGCAAVLVIGACRQVQPPAGDRRRVQRDDGRRRCGDRSDPARRAGDDRRPQPIDATGHLIRRGLGADPAGSDRSAAINAGSSSSVSTRGKRA